MSEIRSVHIYVDGSCSENRNVTAETRAGWGLCVIVNDGGSGNGKGHLFTELYGEVITNQDGRVVCNCTRPEVDTRRIGSRVRNHQG